MKLNRGLFLFVLLPFTGLTQRNNDNQKDQSLASQKLQDSIQYNKLRKESPELFKNKRLAITLQDKTFLIDGYNTDLQIENNYLADSVFHNFHLGMPDTSTLQPYSEIKVTDAKINLTLFSHLMINPGWVNSRLALNGDSGIQANQYLRPFPKSLVVNGKVDNLPINDFVKARYFVRESINGRVIYDWKHLEDFAKQPYDEGIKVPGIGSLSFSSHTYGYNISDTSLQVNDQLLVEIKDSKNDWIVDRYNIRRIAVKPFLSAIVKTVGGLLSKNGLMDTAYFENLDSLNLNYFGWDGNGLTMTEDSVLKGYVFIFRPPAIYYYDELQYKLSGNKKTQDSVWHNVRGAIIIRDEAPDKYELLVRYKNSPENIAIYRWIIKPHWYQTLLFKVITIILMLILLFYCILFINKIKLTKEKQKRRTINLELRSIQSQLNPHFIFNCLSSIQGLINSNKIAEANEYLSEFSVLLRKALIDGDKTFQTLDREIIMLNTYLKLEQLRFQFTYTVVVDDNIKMNEIEIPSLLLQPLVENAVKHGVSDLREKGVISIHFFKDSVHFIAEIQDNGKGFADTENNGYGWKLTDDKIKLLNSIMKDRSIDKKIFRRTDNTVVQLIFRNWFI